MQLHDRLTSVVSDWRAAGYVVEPYPAIAETLEWAHGADGVNVRFLRMPQFRALETYWYLRLVAGTPDVLALYRRFFPKPADFVKALGLGDRSILELLANDGLEAVLDRVRTDDEFVRTYRAEAVRETLTLAYPSYILALAMGAGKTVLMGAIIATEFAMALEYPDGPFVQNALVFAPGKTILESLRELLSMPYAAILPPRFHKAFAASVKMTFTRDGEKDLPVVRGSLFNVVVTNTEKIRIQKETIRKGDLHGLMTDRAADEARAEVANLRLQAIASLPHLAVFSDEAHHTYGQSLDAELKKVRKTVDYLAASTNVLCVVNTTGTPYFQRQPLRDVVIWYGLSQGIREGILKDVAGNIQALHLGGDARQFVAHVVSDFFRDYAGVRLPNGAPAKLAIYFPQTKDLGELRPVVDEALARAGISPALVLVNTSDPALTKQADIDAFNRLNDPAAPHRVLLLVNKGTEGWNCPSLFACALARKLRTSNNFVLQAATRCLRQVPGNSHKARICLSDENYAVLDRQLQETYGERIEDLDRAAQERRRARLVLRKLDIPPLVVRKIVRTVVRKPVDTRGLHLTRPAASVREAFKRVLTLADSASTPRVLQQIGDSVRLDVAPAFRDPYAAATELAAAYRLDVLRVLAVLRAAYGSDLIPEDDLPDLARQVEEQTRHYTPDFVVRKKAPRGWPAGSGRVFIVEIKSEHQRDDRVDGEHGAKAMELRRWEALNPDRLRYQIVFTTTDAVTADQLKDVRQFAEEAERPTLPIPLEADRIATFCRKWRIEELAVFGSVLTSAFRPDSDVDFLAAFAPDARWSLFDETPMEEELAAIVGRKVDLVSRRAIERSHNWIRRRAILGTARPVYVEG